MTVNPKMIRLARACRGHTGVEVAQALGIRQPTYSKIENGLVAVSDEHLTRLSEFLEFPPEFFGQTDRIWGTGSPHHRKRRVATAKLSTLEAQLNVTRLQLRRLAENVEISPHFVVPSISLDEVDTPADAAREVRRLWSVPSGPIFNLTELLEDAGVVIVERPMEDEIDAVSVWGPEESPVILLNERYPTDRKRQTLAHELGHLVMHFADVTDNPEDEAHEFGREFLMPSREIRPELHDLKFNALPDIKRRWRCSMRNVVYHARELGEITGEQARYLFTRLTQEFGSRTEPIELPAEPPSLIREIIDRHLNELMYTPDNVAAIARADPERFRSEFLPSRRLRLA